MLTEQTRTTEIYAPQRRSVAPGCGAEADAAGSPCLAPERPAATTGRSQAVLLSYALSTANLSGVIRATDSY
jgi:hypothetical protein